MKMNTSVDFLKVLAAQFFLKSVIRTFYKLPSTYAYIDPFPIFNKFYFFNLPKNIRKPPVKL